MRSTISNRSLPINRYQIFLSVPLTHSGWVTHICIGKLAIIGSDNGLSPERRQVIIWTNAMILLIWPSGTNFGEILIDMQPFGLKKMYMKMLFAKSWPFCLNLIVLKHILLPTRQNHNANTPFQCQVNFLNKFMSHIWFQYHYCHRYPLLLSRLYKATPSTHPDKEMVRKAQQKVEEILDNINKVGDRIVCGD